MTTATATTDPRLAERFASLATGSRIRQLAPPFAGDEPDLWRRRVYPVTLASTWTAARVNLAGQIVSQLGSKPSTFNYATTEAGYEVEHTIQPGVHFWTAAVRIVSVSRLPAPRTLALGSFGVTGVRPQTQGLVAGQTQLYSIGLSVTKETRVKVRWTVLLGLLYGAGETAYVEGIAQVQSIVHRVPPPIADWAAGPGESDDAADRQLAAAEVELVESEDDEVERIGGFED
jgi:hypothetical protein